MASRLFCLVSYIGYRPYGVVHVGASSRRPLPQALLAILAAGKKCEEFIEAAAAAAAGAEDWGVVTPASFVPSLRHSDLDRVDVVINRDSLGKKMVAEGRAEAGLTREALRAMVGCDAHVDLGAPRVQPIAYLCRVCSRSAEDAGVPALLRCGRCKIVRYCSQQCQQRAWRDHKAFCVPPAAEGAASAGHH